MANIKTKRYQEIVEDLRKNIFLSEKGANLESLLKLVSVAVTNIVEKQGDGPLFPAFKNKAISEVIANSALPQKYDFDHNSLLEKLNLDMQRSVKANSPYMVKNLIPQPSFIYFAAYIASALYMGNAVTGEDAGEALKSELACAAAIAKLAGMNTRKASGVFTFSGTGTNLYGIKLGLAKTDPDHLLNGLNSKDIVVVGNNASHYSQQTAVNWLGVGQLNYIQIKTNPDQTTNLKELQLKCEELLQNGKKIACIEAVGGTTSHQAIDDIEKIYSIRKRLVKKFDLDYVPHIHVDSVQGWVWLNFAGYDFKRNPLGFSKTVLEKAHDKYTKISKLRYADSFGIDFHKTGYTPYNSSMVILKNKNDFNLLKRQKDIMTPLFHDMMEYNPGVYTLETSRSCANILATWITMKSFGQEGYQVMLGHALSMRELFVQAQKRLSGVGLVIEHPNLAAVDVYIRCIKTSSDVVAEHRKELDNDEIVVENNKYTDEFYKWFNDVFQEKDPKVALSRSSASFYNNNGAKIVAMRLYLLSLNNTEETVEKLIKFIIKAKREFDKKTIRTIDTNYSVKSL